MNSLETDSRSDDEVARALSALAHPVRLQILRCLGAADACCVKDLVGRIGLAQSTVSQHLKVLLDAGLVTFRPERQSSRYRIERTALAAAAAALGHVITQCCGSSCCGPEHDAAPASTASRRQTDGHC